MRRVLIVYQSKPTIVSGLKKGFESHGIEVLTFLADEYQLWIDRYVFRVINKLAHNLRILKKDSFLFTKNKLSHWNYLNTKLVDFCNHNNPDGVFFIHGIHYSDETMSQITCSKVGWLVDPVLNPTRLQTFTSKMDWYFSYSQQAIKIVNQFNFSRSSYLPHSVDHRQFYVIPKQPKSIDLCFVGKHSVHREKYILAALELTNRVHIYGSQWLAPALSKPALLRSIKGTECFGEKLNILYNSAKIVLSIIAKPQGQNNLQSGINMRPYEILASGSLLFSDKYEELNSGLVDRKNIVLFDTIDQFKETLAELLKNDGLIESISSSGNQFIQGRFSYDEMAEKIIAKFQEIQGAHIQH
jgi:glycosyltransferase involved in cell wall biosynthesis